MSDSFKIDSFPSMFKWLESAVSDFDEAEPAYNKALCFGVYVTTLACTPLTILVDLCIGSVEAVFQVIRHQDFQKAGIALKSKWVEALFQESTFFVIGITSLVSELGNWQMSYRVTKRLVQDISEYVNLGTPQIFNRIRYPIPQGGLPMPESCVELADRQRFDIYNTSRSQFYKDLNAFKKKYSETALKKTLDESSNRIHGLNNILERVLKATTPVDAMGLNLDSLKESDVRRRLEDMKNCFISYLDNQAVQEGLKVMTSAHQTLLGYLELPIHVRAEIKQP
ncbi:unknown protein [Simkania negevensis Z]|uniref:Uncharacterized protein n=2 Tax=Simkania negevensis TaxID=83561 RepID=F8L5Q0_SIMNZ|nr:unknown protein [Simkania negevensis Z]